MNESNNKSLVSPNCIGNTVHKDAYIEPYLKSKKGDLYWGLYLQCSLAMNHSCIYTCMFTIKAHTYMYGI